MSQPGPPGHMGHMPSTSKPFANLPTSNSTGARVGANGSSTRPREDAPLRLTSLGERVAALLASQRPDDREADTA